MKTSLTKEELGNDPLLETLQALETVLTPMGIELFVVGALARDLAMKLLDANLSDRETTDLDVAIVLKDWKQFEDVVAGLTANHFKKLKAKQKFVYKGPDGKNDYEVDVVPFGEIAENEIIKWPPEQEPEMSVRCYKDVMSHAVEISIADIKIKMAPLAAQFIIKFDTWLDRNDRENKDADDMRFILGNYYNSMIFDPHTEVDIPEEVDVYAVEKNIYIPGAQWIAIEVAKLLSTEHLAYYIDALDAQLSQKEKSKLLQHLTIGKEDSEVFWTNITDALAEMLNIWRRQLDQRSEK